MPEQHPPKTSFLILHGFAYDGSEDHWHNRLAGRLGELGHVVSYPRLPSPEAPRLAEWLAVLRRELEAMPSRDGTERVVICHSLSCLLWIHEAPALADPVDRVLLVSPPEDAKIPPPGVEFAIGEPDVGALRLSALSPPRVVLGDDDPYRPSGVPAWAFEADCEIDRLPATEHINPDDGHGPWPASERWCSDPEVRLDL